VQDALKQDALKQTLIDAGLVLDAHGQGDATRGHISVRVPGDPEHFFMKPHSFGFDEMTLENIVTCNLAGEKVAGGGPRHSEVFIHSEIFRARPDVMSVIHTHPTYTVAFSATGRPLRPISQPSAAFADGLPLYTGTIDLIRSPETGAGVARALGSHKAVVMRSHGAAIAGAGIAEAVMLALALENACQIQILAESTGATSHEFARDDVMRLHDNICNPRQHEINFAYLCRKARRQAGR
jgi:L-fuculose-phosphate aldolase